MHNASNISDEKEIPIFGGNEQIWQLIHSFFAWLHPRNMD